MERPVSWTQSAVQSTPSRPRVDVDRLLKTCAERRAAAKVQTYEPSALFDACFVAPLELEIREALTQPLICGAMINISFQLGGRTGVFLCRLQDFSTQERYPVIIISRPQEALLVESRRSLRFPVVPEAGLTAQLLTPSGPVHFAPVDISMGGLSGSLATLQALEIDWTTEVRLRFGAHDVRLPVRIVRSEGAQVGLAFIELVVGDAVAGLTHVVCELERRWLQR